MSSLSARVPEKLGEIIAKVKIKKGTKNKAIKYLIGLALGDQQTFAGQGKYGKDQTESCTVDMSISDWAAAEPYRLKYVKHDLAVKQNFLVHALTHGASIYEDAEG